MSAVTAAKPTPPWPRPIPPAPPTPWPGPHALQILIGAVLVAGVALVLTPVVTQELWTAQLVLPVLVAGLLPLYVVVSLVVPGPQPEPAPVPVPPRDPDPHPVDPRRPRRGPQITAGQLLAALASRGEL